MPHLILEFSANVKPTEDLGPLFAHLHGILATTGGINIGNCKSRARTSEDYFIADGGEGRGFVHLDVRFIEGRADATKQDIGRQMLDLLCQWFGHTDAGLQITVEIGDIAKKSYFKHPAGTLTGDSG